MFTRREAFVEFAAIGLIAGAGKAFGERPAVKQSTYILPPKLERAYYVAPGQKVLQRTIPLQLVYNFNRQRKVAIAGLEIKIAKAVSDFPITGNIIKVSKIEDRTDRNGLVEWNATIPLMGRSHGSDEKIVISPQFSGHGNLEASPILSTIVLYIKYRRR